MSFHVLWVGRRARIDVLKLFLFYVYWCFAYMYICVQVVDPGVTELPCGSWELNPSPLQEQSVLLTTEPSLQHQRISVSVSLSLWFFETKFLCVALAVLELAL